MTQLLDGYLKLKSQIDNIRPGSIWKYKAYLGVVEAKILKIKNDEITYQNITGAWDMEQEISYDEFIKAIKNENLWFHEHSVS